MTESQFIDLNKHSWERLEEVILSNQTDPDEVNALFIKVSGDLSYARTFYPNRAVRVYLNDLVGKVFDKMRTRKKYHFLKKIKRFYSELLPSIIVPEWKAFVVSFLVFLGGVFIGSFSSFEESSFLREILGNEYVNMTEENIANKDPMAVYKGEEESAMFLGITYNNIRVAFITFVLGLLTSIGSIFVLLRNGIMLGAFQTFFYQKGLFLTSFLTIWIHGTIEISSIIVAGAAGIVLGNSLIFKRSLTDISALKNAAIKALYILISTVPLFIIAGFLEGFVTRMTHLPDLIKWGIILSSLSFIGFIYIYLPYQFKKRNAYKEKLFLKEEEVVLPSEIEKKAMVRATALYSFYILDIIKKIILPLSVIFALFTYNWIHLHLDHYTEITRNALFEDKSLISIPLIVCYTFILLLFFIRLSKIIRGEKDNWKEVFLSLKTLPAPTIIISLLIALSSIYLGFWYFLLMIVVLPMSAIGKWLINQKESHKLGDFRLDLGKAYSNYFLGLFDHFSICFSLLLVFGISYTGITYLGIEILSLHSFFELEHVQLLFIRSVLLFTLLMATMIYCLIAWNYLFTKIDNLASSADLFSQIKKFGNRIDQ